MEKKKPMKVLMFFALIAVLSACEMDEIHPQGFYSCDQEISGAPSHPKNEVFELLIKNIVDSGVPGIQLSVMDAESGSWHGASGYADLASNVIMEPCQITRVGSTVKTFTAVTTLLLQEEGRLHIHDPISNYLSPDDISGLQNAEQATIEQLLKHSSGIYNYIQSAQFQTASLNDLTKVWAPNELLEYAKGKDAYFTPGSDVLYSNTNYILLGMIIEKVTGNTFYEVFEDRIFKPLDMVYTQFAAVDPVPLGIVRGYVDLYSNYNLINATYYSGWDYFTADGGLISNAHDLALFLNALFNGQILSNSSMDQMSNWQAPKVQSADGFKTAYGLGVFRIDTDHGPAYLHSGDAIGYFASMIHFPEQNVTISWSVNGNYGKLDQYTQSMEAMETIFNVVMAK